MKKMPPAHAKLINSSLKIKIFNLLKDELKHIYGIKLLLFEKCLICQLTFTCNNLHMLNYIIFHNKKILKKESASWSMENKSKQSKFWMKLVPLFILMTWKDHMIISLPLLKCSILSKNIAIRTNHT